MSPTLLHAVARRAEALTPDSDLLARFTRDRDHSAFEELLRRHGSLVWNVCRQVLSHHADAEDAFQAVFLALVRSAPTIRDGRTLPAWLHGVAVRVSKRAQRRFARARARDKSVALPETDHPVADESWTALVAAVHEEVQRLPAPERMAFVLCEMEGVAQADAAVRLGWPLGSLSGRLCKARQRLLAQLSARGISPVAAVGCGITAGTVCAVPGGLFDLVNGFPFTSITASRAATAMARSLTGGVAMRLKMTAAVGVIAAAIGLTGSAVVLSTAEAQPQPSLPHGRSAGTAPRVPGTGAAGASSIAPGTSASSESGTQPDTGTGGPSDPPSGTIDPAGPGTADRGGRGAIALAAPTWEYKFVTTGDDHKAFYSIIIRQGQDGWEYCSSERFGSLNRGELVLVFKKRSGGEPHIPMTMTGRGTGGRASGSGNLSMSGSGNLARASEEKDRFNQVFKLKQSKAAEVAKHLHDILGNGPSVDRRTMFVVVPEPVSNSVLVSAEDIETLRIAQRLIESLDAKAKTDSAHAGPAAAAAGTSTDSSGAQLPGAGGNAFPGMPAGPGAPPVGRAAIPGPGKVDLKPSSESRDGSGTGHLKVFILKKSLASEMVSVVGKLFPNAELVADTRTNAVIVRADEQALTQISALISRLDVLDQTIPGM